MSDAPTVHIQFDGDTRGTLIIYQNGDSESLIVSSVGPDLFRLEESSLLTDARFHDIIRASPKNDGSLNFQSVVSKSGLYTEERILSKTLIESEQGQTLLDWVMSVGGMWEQVFGGMLLLHVPPQFAEALRYQIKNLKP
jgi:hypothetical protein